MLTTRLVVFRLKSNSSCGTKHTIVIIDSNISIALNKGNRICT